MSKQLTMFLTLLRKQPVSTASVVNFLEKDDTASLLGLDGLVGSLSSYIEDDLPIDVVDSLIGTTELTINQQKDLAEKAMNSMIISNSFSNYQEIVTSAKEDISDATVISEYKGKSDDTNLEYYVLHSPIPDKSFMIGELHFQISPLASIPFTVKGGVKSSISYKFLVKITSPSNPVAVGQKFDNFRIDTFFHVIGMSFLKPKDISIVRNADLIIMELNTFNFYDDLALKYNIHYGNLRRLDDVKLTEIAGIESCQVDSNGLILVPKLFFMSSIYTDGDIGTRPFIWAPNEGIAPIPLQTNNYKISLSISKSATIKERDAAIASLISRMSDFGATLSVIPSKEDSKGTNIGLSIVGYHGYSENNHDYQLEYSAKFNLESKVSAAFRKLCQGGIIGSNDYNIRGTGNSVGTEKYAFVYNHETRSIEASYDRNVNKFLILYNRSGVTTPADTDGQVVNLVKAVNERNSAKFKNTGVMIESLEQNGQRIEYQGQQWPTVPGDFIPTSFIHLILTKREKVGSEYVEKKYIGISWIPFGFVKFVSTNPNVALNESGFSIYGSDIEMTPITVRKVLKLTTNPGKINNINQVIFESETVPQFHDAQPLKISKLDASHYLCLFRATNKIEPTTQINWSYISDYMQNTDFVAADINASKTLTVILDGEKFIRISKRAILRYFGETMGVVTEFNSLIFNHLERIFTEGDTISADSFCNLFINDNNFYSDDDVSRIQLPRKFFELLRVAAVEGTINDNIIDCIAAMLTLPENSSLLSVRNFIKSIKIPVKSNDYPTFTNEMQMSITNGLNEEINHAVDSIYTISDSLIDKTGIEIFNVATSQTGILRTLLEMIAKNIIDSGVQKASSAILVEFKNASILYLTGLIENPILPELIGTQIKPSFISYAAERLNKVIFYRLVRLINQELTVAGYEDTIIDICKTVTSRDETFIVTVISPYRYTVTFNESLLERIYALDGMFIPSIDLSLAVTDDKTHVNEFGEYIYDSNVHIMFEVTYPETKNVNDVILSSIRNGSIYYTQITDTYVLPDLSIVSLYEIPSESSGSRKVKFFLPFTFSGAKLTVDKTSWVHENATFELLNKTVEIELGSEEIGIHQSFTKRLIYETLIDISPTNLKTVRSLFIGGNPVKKGYTLEGKQSHYFFTKDLNELLTSGTYTPDSDIISEDLWQMIPSEKLSIFIHPIPPINCLYYLRTSGGDNEILKIAGKALKLPKKELLNETNDFVENYKSEFIDEFSSVTKQRDTVLITRNKKGIYTSALSTRSAEIQVAAGLTPFHESPVPVDLSDLDRLNEIEVIAVKEQVNHENEKLYLENLKHNLALVLSTIKWNSKQVENYRFFSDEKPKWMKFSKDSSFMAIGFQGGVKLYIRSADQYVFCTNLPHEGVSEVIFGNSNLCVTQQYQNPDKPFAKLWIAAAGIQIPITLDFYRVADGDIANIKYISGTTNKEKKNVFINVVVEDKLLDPKNSSSDSVESKKTEKIEKVMFGGIAVQTATPTFDHNVYFFSPNDAYFIYNSKGTFKVVDMNSMKHVDLVSSTSLIKPFESGTWLSDTQFMGITYSTNSALSKQRVIINFEKMTATQSQILTEFPTMVEAESMVVEGYTKIHPLYSYLVKQRDSYKDVMTGKVGQDGIWIYDLYVSIRKRQDTTILLFNTTDGFYDSLDIELQLEGQTESDYLSILASFWAYETVTDSTGIHVESITWLDKLLFKRSNCDRSKMVNIQCINGNYFSFFGDSIFVWSYTSAGTTELTHIDSDGFEKMFFDESVAIIIGSVPKAGKFEGDRLIVVDINLGSTVTYDKEPVQVTSIIKPIKEKSTINVMAYTETCFETYSNDSEVIPVIIDTRAISSAMCLNRYPVYTLKSHVDSTNIERFTPYDNLLISCEKNVVKIIPRTVQTAPSTDGLVTDWYRSQDEDSPEYWETKRQSIESYITKAYVLIPQLTGLKPVTKLDYEFITNIMRLRDATNFEMGITELINYKWPQYLIDTFRTIFSIMKRTSFLYSPNSLIDDVKDYWSILTSKRPFAIYMKSILEPDREAKYNEAIAAFSVLAGDNFISFTVGTSFRMIYESQFLIIGGIRRIQSINTIKTNLEAQILNATPQIREKIELILFILSIPYIHLSIVNFGTLGDYNSRLDVLKDELTRVIKMSEKSNRYTKYKCMEIRELQAIHDIYLRRSMAYRTKMYHDQSEADFALCLKSKYELIRPDELPDGIVFDFYGRATFNKICYFDQSAKVPIKIGEEKVVVYHPDKTPVLYADGTRVMTTIDISDFVNGDIKSYAMIPEETFNLLSMIKTIKHLCNTIEIWTKNQGKELFKDGVNIFDLIGVLDGRKIKTEEADHIKLTSYKIQLLQFLKDEMTVEFQLKDISLARTKLIEDLFVIYGNRKSFETTKDLFNFIFSILSERFPKSIFNTYNKIPSYIQDVLDTYTIKISDDSEAHLLEYNIHHIDDMFGFYSTSLKRGYYLPNEGYTEDMIEVKKRLVPLLWNYRNGVAYDRGIPVTAIKLVFDQPVRFKVTDMFKQNEKNDLTFEYEIPEANRLYDEKYGTVSVNLIDVIKGFEDRSEISSLSTYDTITNSIAGISYDVDVLESAIESNLITVEKANNLIRSLLVKVDGPYETLSQYKTLLKPTYSMINFSLSPRVRETPSKYLANFYPRSSQMTIFPLELKYFFYNVTAGLDFDGVSVHMKYENKHASVIDSFVNISKSNFAIGSFRPVSFEPRLITTSNGRPAKFTDASGSDFIAYYGNTIIDKINRGFIVTQRLIDRKMTTYFYIKTFKFPDGRSKDLEDATYLISIESSDDGKLKVVENVDDRRYEHGKGLVDITVEKNSVAHISGLMSQWKIQTEMNDIKFNESVITDVKTVTKGKVTITISSYKTGRHFGSIIEVFEMIGGRIEVRANWNLYLVDIKTFDFNDSELIILATTWFVSGYNVRVGIIDLKKRSPEKKSIFIQTFDREIKLGSPLVDAIDTYTVVAGTTSYVTYRHDKKLANKDDSKPNFLIILNERNSYESQFNTDITSIRVSKESGYVALYFDKTDITEIWSASGSLYRVVHGECNWM